MSESLDSSAAIIENMSDQKKAGNYDHIQSYDVLRALLTLVVVLGHCAYYSIITDYGGIDYSGKMLREGVNDSMTHRFFMFLCSCIYSFHMPLFMALSGALYESGLKRNQVCYNTVCFSSNHRIIEKNACKIYNSGHCPK